MFAFLAQAIVISLSGVLAPGPMTAATLAAGVRSRHAGLLLAVGHALVEFPLMLAIMAGLNTLFELKGVTIGIGLAGGLFLLLMGAQILSSLRKPPTTSAPKHTGSGPLWTGVVLTAANPYFLIWWATIGLTLTSKALHFGALAFGLFAVLHWLCDAIWLEILSVASFKGSQVFGPALEKAVQIVCGVALLILGSKFIWDVARQLLTSTA